MTNSRPILVIENEENDVFFLKHALQKAGVNNPIVVVETGQQAIAYLKGEGEYADRVQYPIPSLIFLDLKLRGIDGTEVLSWIRQKSAQPTVPVIVLSSSMLATDVAKSYRNGANSYVIKTADPNELVQMMRDFAQWWLKHNVPAE